ncbi:MAG TPA: IS30 family transposase [Candidatus Saccharimonadia bacterium]|nr:IS30 family transposase [Candidatus Saccharimonadia bacterium]
MRDRIKALLDDGYGVRKIGRTLGLSHSTVSREVTRNRFGDDGRTPLDKRSQYEPEAADHKAYVRRKYAKYQGKKIQEHDQLREYVIAKLKAHWNPDEISGAMKQDRLPFYASKTSIYEWLYSEWGQPYCEYLYTKRPRPKKQRPKTEKHMIPNRVSITERPLGATNRTRYGHWEGDTVVSGKRTGSTAALVVAVERKTRYVAAQKIPNLKPESFNDAVCSIQTGVTKMLSLSLDNGIENRWHDQLTIPAYFCDPYSSWQKGGVENANKMIRRYLPKGMDLAAVTPARLQDIIWIINNKPRKILGYKSALQLAKEKGVLRG